MAEEQKTMADVRPGDVVVRRAEVSSVTWQATGQVTLSYVGGGSDSAPATDPVTVDTPAAQIEAAEAG